MFVCRARRGKFLFFIYIYSLWPHEGRVSRLAQGFQVTGSSCSRSPWRPRISPSAKACCEPKSLRQKPFQNSMHKLLTAKKWKKKRGWLNPNDSQTHISLAGSCWHENEYANESYSHLQYMDITSLIISADALICWRWRGKHASIFNASYVLYRTNSGHDPGLWAQKLHMIWEQDWKPEVTAS